MEVDVSKHKLMSKRQLACHPIFANPDTGKPAHKTVIERAFSPGHRSVSGDVIPLPSLKLPRCRVSSDECLNWWAGALNNRHPVAVSEEPAAATPNKKSRESQIDAAEAEFAAAKGSTRRRPTMTN